MSEGVSVREKRAENGTLRVLTQELSVVCCDRSVKRYLGAQADSTPVGDQEGKLKRLERIVDVFSSM